MVCGFRVYGCQILCVWFVDFVCMAVRFCVYGLQILCVWLADFVCMVCGFCVYIFLSVSSHNGTQQIKKCSVKYF